MDVRPDQVVQLVEDAVDDFDQQMPLLVFQGGRHQQRQDLVEQRPGAKLSGFVRDLAQCGLGGGRRQTTVTAWSVWRTFLIGSQDARLYAAVSNRCVLLVRAATRANGGESSGRISFASKYSHCSHIQTQCWVLILQLESPHTQTPPPLTQLITNLPHGRRSVFDLQQQLHDLPLFLLLGTQGRLVHLHLGRFKGRSVNHQRTTSKQHNRQAATLVLTNDLVS